MRTRRTHGGDTLFVVFALTKTISSGSRLSFTRLRDTDMTLSKGVNSVVVRSRTYSFDSASHGKKPLAPLWPVRRYSVIRLNIFGKTTAFATFW